jgi:hypothetical protein
MANTIECNHCKTLKSETLDCEFYRGSRDLELCQAAKCGDLETFISYEDVTPASVGYNMYCRIVEWAAISGHVDILTTLTKGHPGEYANDVLIHAAAHGQLGAMAFVYLRWPYDPLSTYCSGMDAAAEFGQLDAMRLVHSWHPLSKGDGLGDWGLLSAAYGNQTEAMRLLIKWGAELDGACALAEHLRADAFRCGESTVRLDAALRTIDAWQRM